MASLKASIVVPAYSRSCRNKVRRASPRLVRTAVLSACAQDVAACDYEVIVVHCFEDGSIDRMIEELGFPGSSLVRVLKSPDSGPTAARDLGARHARGEILAFLDSDHRAAAGWLRAGLAAFDDTTGIVQGRTVPEPDSRAGVLTRYVRREAENCYYETSNIFYRRSSFEAAGGFAEAASRRREWQRRAEAIVLAWRIRRAGWRTAFASEALAYSEVTPLPVRHWLFDNGLYRLPWVMRRVPEMRRHFCARYFFDRHQLALVVALPVLFLYFVTPAALLLAAPYFLLRACEGTRTMAGALRLARPLFYLPRDLVSLALLVMGSVRYRAVLL